MDYLTSLAIFVRVVEKEGFTAAARDLGLSKSAVSKHVAQVETRLGVRLLNRTTRRLSPTEAGLTFYGRAQGILADVTEAESAVTRLHTEPRGILRVNAPMSFGILHLGPLLPDFMDRYPDISLDLSFNDRVVDMIEEGFDAAIRIARLPDSTLIARRLAPFCRVVCATQEYWRRHGIPKHPKGLKDHDCVIYTYLATCDEWPFRGPEGPLSVKVSGCLRANNVDALRAAALAGRGVLLSPTFIVSDDLRAGRLQAVLTDFVETDRSIYAVYPSRRNLSAKVRVFVDFLTECYGPKPPWDAEL